MKAVCRYSVLWALFVILVMSPGPSDESFLVELHNGRKLSVEGYRVEGTNYELYLESGSLRVPVEEIRSIKEKKDDVVSQEKKDEVVIQEKKDDVVRLPKEETEKDKPETAGDPGEQNLSKNSVPQGTEIESYIQRKAELRERLEEAKRVYFTVTEKSEKDRARQRMISASRELFSLEAEVKGKHNGSLPDWWKEN